MAEVHDAFLLCVGAWLFLYRLALGAKCIGVVAEPLTTVCCGLSLSLLAPLLPWPPEGFRAISLSLVGVLCSFCHPAITTVLVVMPVGVGLGSLLWQLGLCGAAPGAHAIVLSAVVVTLVGLFVFTPRIAGIWSLYLVLVPSLSALLLTMAVTGLVPSLGTLEPRQLLLASPCAAAEEGGGLRAPLLSLACWTLTALCAVGLQIFLAWKIRRARMAGKGGGGGAARGPLLASLLPGAGDDDDDDDEGFKRPGSMQGNDRFQTLVKAIYDEDFDLSTLTANEKSIVLICRENEFERDRLLWGGGLI